MKTVQNLSLEESFTFGFNHLAVTSHSDMITVNQEMHLHSKMNAFIENMPTRNEGLNIIAELPITMVNDNTVCDTNKKEQVELTKQFVEVNGYNIIIESHNYYDFQFKSYTLKETDFNKICF